MVSSSSTFEGSSGPYRSEQPQPSYSLGPYTSAQPQSSYSSGPHTSVQPQPSYSSGRCRPEPIECSNSSETFWMWIFLWKEDRLRDLMSSPGAPSAGPSTPSRYSSVPSTPPSYSLGPSTPQIYSPGSSRNAECSNCKQLRGRISVLKATMEMHMHPEQHTLNSAALLHEVLNEMEKLDLE
ncbi:hypothetical protein Tco_1381022 [Tanacetum coccineum]